MWRLSYPKTESFLATEHEHEKATDIWVECEFARGAFMSEAHKWACDGYDARGFVVPEHEATAY